MNNSGSTFFSAVHQLIDQLHADEGANISLAAGILKSQIAQGRLIHVFGVSGHSVIGCEEFFWRAGGLACISPIFDLSLNLSGGGLKSTALERVPGVGDKAVKVLNLDDEDVLIITSIYGMNAATIDAALEAKSRGVKIIAITSKRHAEQTPRDFVARHPSGKNLADIADVTIDNHVPHGDCLIQRPGYDQKVGPGSTILVSCCVQWLVIETLRQCEEAGIQPPVWCSANMPGGDQLNHDLIGSYAKRIKAL
ncbi:MAG: SIS domain-containing protein [Verrucomicrobiota bacterium]